MLQIQIIFFVIILGLFRQPFANAKSAAVPTLKRLTIDAKNIKKPDIGFSVQKNMPKCTCPDNVDLDEKKPNGEIDYNKLDSTSSFVCCTNCVSIISAPPGYQVEVTKVLVDFYNDPKASLTIRNGKENDGYVLGKLTKSEYVTFLLSAVNAMTVTYNSSNTASSCRYIYYTVTAKLHKLPTSSPVNYSLSSDRPFHLIMNKNLSLSNIYWTVTAETGKQVHLYLYGSMTNLFKGKIFVIDGTDVNGTVISQVTHLSASSNGRLSAYSSSNGSLTILLDFTPYSSDMDVNFLFTQLENDPSQCGTSKFVYLSSEKNPVVKVSIRNHGGGTASCPAVLVTKAPYSVLPGIQLNISSLQGSMVLYEGLDYPPSSKKEIKRFSSMNDVISPVKASERVFLIQLHPGSMINFTFRTLPYWKTSSPGLSSNWTGIIACAAAAVAALYIRYLARFKSRSQQNDANVAVLTVHLVPSQPNEGDLPPSYEEAAQQNDANLAVLTVHLVPSQPNEGDLPPSYEEAAQQNDANLAVLTVHLVSSQPNERDLPPSYEEAAQ